MELLIQLAKEKGFEAFHVFVLHESQSHYLWLCLLQKWLRDQSNKNICVSWTPNSHWLFELNFDDYNVGGFESYQIALEQGCLQALKLI